MTVTGTTLTRALTVLAGALAALAVLVPAAAHADGPVPSGPDLDYQLGGAARPDDGVGIVVRDRLEDPADVALDVCYVNGFQTQPNEKRFWLDQHRDLLLTDDGGHLVEDAQWGEWLLDVSTPAKRRALVRIVGRWTQGCADHGYEAVEYDNLDSFTRSRGHLDRADGLRFAAMLADAAEDAGLAAGQKNLAGWDGTRAGFDFAVSEQCGRYRECRAYHRHYGDQVLAVEYGRTGFRRACDQYGDEWPIVMRDVQLRPGGVHRYC